MYPIAQTIGYGPVMDQAIRIIGIDPGLRRTGWGIVACAGSRLSFVAAGTVASDGASDLADRLKQLHAGLSTVFERYAPGEAAVEATFVNRDAAATLKLGQARGIAMLVPAQAGLAVAEYAPNQVKKTVVGTGHGAKQQIRTMVSVLLPQAEYDSDDAADALAIAICHAHHRRTPAAQIAVVAAGALR
jgi:crossover junction endodeoxyribonuclease RuvC